MAETEINVISHLLDVEHSASELISGAQLEADKRTAAAHAQADAEYKKQYDALTELLESDYAQKTAELSKKHDKEILDYKSKIENTEKDAGAFNKLLDSVLFAG